MSPSKNTKTNGSFQLSGMRRWFSHNARKARPPRRTLGISLRRPRHSSPVGTWSPISKTEYGLFKEGDRLHHCVLNYKYDCTRGDISIWSLRCEYPLGKLTRGVTIEVRKDGSIVQ